VVRVVCISWSNSGSNRSLIGMNFPRRQYK
jgi:hypothetical protein